MNRPTILASLTGFAAALFAPLASAQYGCDRLLIEADDAMVQAVEESREMLSSGLESRWQLVDRLLRPYFDFAFSSRWILDTDRNEFSDEQLQRFSDAFYRFLLYSFGHLVTEYEADTLRLVGDCRRAFRPWGYVYSQGARLELTGKRPETIDLDIALHEVDDEFRIFDIQHEGTSQIMYYRGQFVDRLNVEGLDALIVWLEEEAERQRELQLGQAASDAGGDSPDD